MAGKYNLRLPSLLIFKTISFMLLITIENINLIKAVKFMLDKVGGNKRKEKK